MSILSGLVFPRARRALPASFYSQIRRRHDCNPRTALKVFDSITSLRQWRRRQLFNYRSVGLVPTMGALHEGHLSLIRMAAKENAEVIVSIYVNPTQFSINEDYDSYPKTWQRDFELLRDLDRELAEDGSNFGKIAAIFAPKTSEIYPGQSFSPKDNQIGSFVTVNPLDQLLEGASRPLFFRGVATICTKLLNIVTPERIYFGQKDIQQTVVIKKLVKDLCIDTQVIVGETQRALDGLALSSRNVYLGPRRRKFATALINTLRFAELQYLSGSLTRSSILDPALAYLSLAQDEQMQIGKNGVCFELDYISLADPETLEEIQEIDSNKGAVLSGAIKMLPLCSPQHNEVKDPAENKTVRILDNIILKPVENVKH
ncbi:Pantothenate synthetase [Golovinomyces cichoracearum]|uniref:Pantoate--beta-alanine ligase n=1 Tax=Golovinomyces cichoracearum TaxID=62708 RepID=A0A420II43_9PEZI|nr:Pantothenate synthetase [Golovinomyces cichoracearum]